MGIKWELNAVSGQNPILGSRTGRFPDFPDLGTPGDGGPGGVSRGPPGTPGDGGPRGRPGGAPGDPPPLIDHFLIRKVGLSPAKVRGLFWWTISWFWGVPIAPGL